MSDISKLILKNKSHQIIINEAAKISQEESIDLYIVGGYVRDSLINKQTIDLDLAVTKNAEKFARKLSKKLNVNKVVPFEKFQTYRIPYKNFEIEVAQARTESYNKDSRKPREVIPTDITEDLSRRDFTINAMAVSLNKNDFGKLIDPYQGLQDLNKGLIKTPLEPNITFSDDPLRILRAIRFAAQLNFEIHPDTLIAINQQIKRIEIISWERITAEIIKILKTEKPSIGFYLLKDVDLLKYIFPELDIMPGIDVINGHSHKDVFIHTLEVVDNAAQLTNKMKIRFAALVHDIAKPQTKKYYKDKGWTFHGHEEIGRRMIRTVAKRMKLSNELRDYLMILTKLHLRPIALAKKDITDRAVRRVMFEAKEYLDDLMILCRADITTKNSKKIKQYMKNFERVESLMKNVKMRDEMKAFKCPINGYQIMKLLSLKEGKKIGKIKYEIETAILDEKINNTYDSAYEYMMKIKDNILLN